MTSQPDLAAQALSDSGLIEEMQFLEHQIQFGPTQTGWVSPSRGRGNARRSCSRPIARP
jgi:hypothetical protein